MQVKTILNRVTDYKSFVFGKIRWVESDEALALEVEIEPRANGHLSIVCGGWIVPSVA